MIQRQGEATATSDRQLVITRIFDAPRELVWKAWTEPERFMRWWGPKDITSPRCEIDLRVAGRYLWCMRWPDGRDTYTTGVYREIVPPERLVYTDSFADAEGNIVPASHYGIDADFALVTQVTVTFEEHEGKTKMTLTHAVPAGDIADLTAQGWNESFDKLAESLRSSEVSDVTTAERQALVITRVFDAPRELVWKAWTEPERFMRWWGPKIFTSPRCEIDLRVGGRFLWSMRWPDGRVNITTGEYREVVPVERLVYVTSFADADGNVVPATHYGMSADIALEMEVAVTFEEHGGKTTMTLTHAGIPAGGMSDMTSQGWNESFDKLADSLRS